MRAASVTFSSACFFTETSMGALQVLNLPGKQGISWKFALQLAQQFHSLRLVLFAHIGDCQEEPRKWRQIVTVLGGRLEILDASLLVGRKPPHAQNPAYRRRHASNDVLAESGRQPRVVAIVAHRKQPLR